LTPRRTALRHEKNPAAQDVAKILAGLGAFNAAQVGRPADPKKFFLSVRDGDGVVVGGLVGVTYWDWMYVDYLWLSDGLRGRGWGRRLIERAERIALARGCRGAWLDTFSFQAPGFYRRMGYREFGSMKDHPTGKSRHFFWKPLAKRSKATKSGRSRRAR
jgi:GNAT superfamily N-acetyltransferase